MLVVRDGKASRQPVKLGMRGDGTVQVLSGLAPGEAVVAPAADGRPGAPGAHGAGSLGAPTMRFEWFIAIRYLREGKAQTALVLGGTTVGVAVLIFLTALISGLQRTLVAQTLSAQAHVLVKAPERVARPLPSREQVADHVEKVPDRIRSIEQWQQVLASIGTLPGVVAATPTAAGAAFASRGPATKSVTLRGIDPESFARVIDVVPKMKSGRFALEGAEAIIGTVLAERPRRRRSATRSAWPRPRGAATSSRSPASSTSGTRT